MNKKGAQIINIPTFVGKFSNFLSTVTFEFIQIFD